MVRFFEILPVTGIRPAVRQLVKHRHFSSAINLSRPSPARFYKQRTPDISFERDIAWCLGILDVYKEDIRNALLAERTILTSIFNSNWAAIEEAIDELEHQAGISMWSLALRGATLTAQGRAEEKRQLLTTLNSSAGDNRFFTSVLYLKMNRLDEADILTGQSRSFEQKIKRTFSAETLHFLMYKIVQHSFDFDLDFSMVLRVEKNSCPIDIFNALQDFVLYSRFSSPKLQFPELVKTVAASLAKIGDDNPTKALGIAYGGNHGFSLPRPAYQILDLYTIGDYDGVCSLMETDPSLAENFVLTETWAKAAARSKRFPPGYIGRLLYAMSSVLAKDVDFGVSNAFLLAQCESFGGLSWFRELHFFVIRETMFLNQDRNAQLRWISWAISGIDTPLKIAVLPEPIRTRFAEALKPLESEHIVVRFIQSALRHPKNRHDFPTGIEQNRLAKYLSLSYAQSGDHRRAVRILRMLARNADPIVSYDATRELVGILIEAGRDDEAIQRYVHSVISNPALQRAFDTEAIAAACERLVQYSASIELPIALSLHSRYIDEKYDATLRYSFEMFLERTGLMRPEEVADLGIPNELTNYFLEHVAIPPVMKLLPVFGTLADIENCRIAVCRLLIDRQYNVEEMIDEVKNRNRQLVIAAGTKLIESSRIYADTSVFLNAGSSGPYRQLYERYLNLVRKNDFQEAEDEIEFSRLLGHFQNEPLLLANVYKIHVQHTILNEKNATFLQLLKLMRDEFTFGVRGLAGYLSTRIRHGHLPNILRRSLSDEGLVLSRNLATGVYRDDAAWFLHLKVHRPNKEWDLHRAFHEFSTKLDAAIDQINDHGLQIFAVDQDISGLSSSAKTQKNLFNYSVTALEAFHLQRQLDLASDYPDFAKLVVNWLWRRTETNLEEIREKLDSEVRSPMLRIADDLSRSIEQISGDFFENGELSDSLNRAKSALNAAVDTVKAWFVRSRGAIPTSFESVVPVEIARLSSQVRLLTHEDDTGFFYKGIALSYFVDFLFVLLDNCVSKSGLDADVQVNTSFVADGESLHITVRNNCIPVVDVDWANEELQFYRDHYGKESYSLRAAQGEGGSGFFKVWKALTKDLELAHQIWFGYTSDDTFEVRITINLADLAKALYESLIS